MFSFWFSSILVPIWITLFFCFKCNKKYGIGFAVALILIAVCLSERGDTIWMFFIMNLITTIMLFVIGGLLDKKLPESTPLVLIESAPLVLTAVIMFIFCMFIQIEHDNRALNNIKDSVWRSHEAAKSLREGKIAK